MTGPILAGGIFINLPDWRREDWSEILVRARTSDKVNGMDVGFRMREKLGPERWAKVSLQVRNWTLPVIRDGSVQTYTLRADWSRGWTTRNNGRGLGATLVSQFSSREPASVELLSVSVIPKEASLLRGKEPE